MDLPERNLNPELKDGWHVEVKTTIFVRGNTKEEVKHIIETSSPDDFPMDELTPISYFNEDSNNEETFEEGDFGKFVVLNINDITKYLPEHHMVHLSQIEECISNGRRYQGKKTNKYLVINTDESYAEEIVNILKKNGHWGKKEVADEL